MAKKDSKKLTKKEIVRQERIKIRKQFKEWSIKIRDRDGNKCRICGAVKYIHAHHLIPRENKEFRFDLDNGIALCAKHHKYSLEISPHKNPIVFILWLQKNRKKQWNIIQKWIKNNEFRGNRI